MYLSKKTYVKQWEHLPKEEQFEVTVKRNGKVFDQIEVDRISYVEEQVMYWRKANHIHNWFVQNCQGSVDDGRSTYVSVEDLKNLYDACKKVMEFDAASAPNDILPTTEGFFFGSTDYDEYYYQNIKDTIEFLEKEMDADGKFNGDYYYEASW